MKSIDEITTTGELREALAAAMQRLLRGESPAEAEERKALMTLSRRVNARMKSEIDQHAA